MDRYYDIWTTVSDCWGLGPVHQQWWNWRLGIWPHGKKKMRKAGSTLQPGFLFCFFPSVTPDGNHPHHKGCCALHIVQAKELGHPRCQNWCCRLSCGRHACTRCSVVMLPGWQGFCLQPSWKREHWWTVVRWASSSRRFELLRICAEKSHLYYYQGMVWLRDR